MSMPDHGHKMTDKELDALEKRITGVYGKAYKDIKKEIEDYFKKFEKRDAEKKSLLDSGEITEAEYKQWRLAQIGRGKRFEDMRDKLAERMTNANEVAISYVNDVTPGIYTLNRNYAAYTIEKQVGHDIGFTIWDEQTVKRLVKEQPSLLPNYPKEKAVKRGIDLEFGKKQITSQVTQGILQGDSIKDLSDRLQENIPTMNRDSAVRTARTAVTGAQNAGRLDSYQDTIANGIKLKKEWIATLDNRTRHEHAMLDGKQVDVDKPFEIEGYTLMYPGDPNGEPEMVYNCRCTMVTVIDGIDTSDAKRRSTDLKTGKEEIVPNMTYSEWAKWKKEQDGN